MTAEEIDRVEGFQRELREQLHRLDEPKMVLEGDDEYGEIRGNEKPLFGLPSIL